jgi:glucose-6-phosphate 1-dehydrogenase
MSQAEDVFAAARIDPAAGLQVRNCTIDGQLDPCVLVIFGATGDLTSRKLFPALYTLFCNRGLPERMLIIGAARADIDSEGFRGRMRSALIEAGKELTRFEEMAARLHYHKLETYDHPDSYRELARLIGRLDQAHSTAGNRLFYLALPPELYETVSRMLGAVGLGAEHSERLGWSRLVVEKPFGHDLTSARRLNEVLSESFREHQIFRIDHYLAKETVQNLLLFRFANAIFEPVWNRVYIKALHIRAHETLGVEHRAGYYEQAGVIRDMFQNHLMQVLSLAALEPPSLFEAERVRDEKSKVFRCLRPFPTDRVSENLVLGQYVAGSIGTGRVPGYIDEPGVAPDSQTPTYAMMKVFIDNWRWQGVPIFLSSGKRMAEKRTEVVVEFKEVPYSMFRNVLGEHVTANRLTMGIYPDEVVNLNFQSKNPGPKLCLRSVTMHFHYGQGYKGPVFDAYEKVLIDCIKGEQILFWRQDGLELCWSFLTPILEKCECENRPALHLYKAGGMGPEAARGLVEREGGGAAS